MAGAIVPDLPVEESGPLAELCRREDFSLIQLITPTTPRDRALRSPSRQPALSIMFRWPALRASGGVAAGLSRTWPGCGSRRRCRLHRFGISRPEHVRMLAPVADGLIVGSAIVRRVADAAAKPRAVLDQIGDYLAELLSAMG